MSLFDFVKKQFIDVIQCTEDDDSVLAWRYPMQDMEIQNGGSLTVRDSQVAIFVNEGQIADVFQAGRYTLTTQTLPVLTYLKNWDKLFQSPFKSDVYFFSTRHRIDRKWGTQNPITIRDKEFGMVRMRAFGIYSYRIADPKVFHQKISGTRETYTTDELEGQLRNSMVGVISEVMAGSGVSFIDMAGNQTEFANAVKGRMEEMFSEMGLALETFVVQNISLPEELQKMLDKRIGMNMLGDMGRYTQYQVAESIPLAAQNEGGMGGMMAQMGAGLGLGQQIGLGVAQALNQSNQQIQQAAPAATPAAPAASLEEDVFAKIEKLHAMKEKGILTEEEFASKKSELLAKIA